MPKQTASSKPHLDAMEQIDLCVRRTQENLILTYFEELRTLKNSTIAPKLGTATRNTLRNHGIVYRKGSTFHFTPRGLELIELMEAGEL